MPVAEVTASWFLLWTVSNCSEGLLQTNKSGKNNAPCKFEINITDILEIVSILGLHHQAWFKSSLKLFKRLLGLNQVFTVYGLNERLQLFYSTLSNDIELGKLAKPAQSRLQKKLI